MANLFLLGMPVFGGIVLFAGFFVVRHLNLSDSTARTALGCLAVLTLFITGFAARYLLRWVERRR